MSKYYLKYLELYNEVRSSKIGTLKDINDVMFFVTDSDTIFEHMRLAKDNELLSEIASYPERFMPKENIMITVLPPEKDKKLGESFIASFVTSESTLLTTGSGTIKNLSIEEKMKKAFVSGTVSYILTALNNKKTEVYYKDTNFKTKSGRDKIVPVVFIRNNSKNTIYENYIPADVEWKHSWECVGHWRVVKGIGKDRHGEYNQLRRTWVNPCIKGDGTLIKKTRLIQKAEIIQPIMEMKNEQHNFRAI